MDNQNVKIGGGGETAKRIGGAVLAFLKRISPFEFKTLQEFPFPTWAVPFAIVFFFGIWHWYERNVDNSPTINVKNGINALLHTDQNGKPQNPNCLVIGNSHTGMSLHRDVLEKRLQLKSAKVALGSLVFRDTFNFVKKYESELSDVKVMMVNLSPRAFFRETLPYDKIRLRFFKNPFSYETCSAPITIPEIFLPMRFSLRVISANQKSLTSSREFSEYHEYVWNEPSYANVKKKYTESIENAAKTYRQKQERSVDTYQHRKIDSYQLPLVEQFADYCAARGIFVVFTVFPAEISRTFSWGPHAKPEDYEYLSVVRAMQARRNCAVVIAANFDEILKTPRDYSKEPALTFDDGHMTEEGATIYTNWLVDQMLNDPKIMTALKTPRKPPEFFVKRWIKQIPYTKETYMYLAGFVRKSGVEQAKPTLVASPQGNAQTR
ncbi:MAG: hypothetical protein ACRCUY_08905 [Thermoguttaceae bacterium]